jgi:hypothetical protein
MAGTRQRLRAPGQKLGVARPLPKRIRVERRRGGMLAAFGQQLCLAVQCISL